MIWVLSSIYKVVQLLGLRDIIPVLMAMSFIPVGVHYLRKEMSEQNMLFEALRSFDVRQSACRDSFDDEFINAAISVWFGSVDQFNNHVRTKVLGRLKDL